MSAHEVFAEWSRWGWLMLANHLWQATLFAALAWAAARLLSKGPARARTVVWLLVSAKFVLPLALFAYLGALAGVVLSRPAAAEEAPATLTVWTIVEPVGAAVSGPLAKSAPSAHGEFYCVLTAVWLVGCAASLAFWASQHHRLWLAVRAGRRLTSGREHDALERARFRLGVARRVGLIASHGVDEPGVWRALRPVVVLPEGVGEHLADDELEAVMMHEVSHVARRDNLVANLQMLLCCLFWFHPVVWLVDRKLLAERERACDEAVLGAGGGARVYAAGLLKVFRFSIGWRPAGVSCATGSHLGRRIEQIMVDSSERIATKWHRAVVASVVTIMAGVSAVAAFNGPTPQSGEKRVQRADVVIQRSGGEDDAARKQTMADLAAKGEFVKNVDVQNLPGAPIAIGTAELRKVKAEDLATAMGGPRVAFRTFEKHADAEAAEAEAKAAAEAEAANAERITLEIPEAPPGAMTIRTLPGEGAPNGDVYLLTLTLSNVSDRVVSEYQFGAGETDKNHTLLMFFNGSLKPGDSTQLVLPIGGEFLDEGSSLAIKGVKYEDGTTWGEFAKVEPRTMVFTRKGSE